MKKFLFLIFFVGLLFFLSSHLNTNFVTNKSFAYIAPSCGGPGACTVSPQQEIFSECGIPSAGRYSIALCYDCTAPGTCMGPRKGCWGPWNDWGSCGAPPPPPPSGPTPTTGVTCNVGDCDWFCNGSCDVYYPKCSGNACAQSSTLYQSNSTMCDGIHWNGVAEACYARGYNDGASCTPPAGTQPGLGLGLDANTPAAWGWSCDRQRTDLKITVHLYLDGPAGSGIDLGTVVANKPRKETGFVANSKCGDVNHGWVYTIPDQYQNGTHTIYAYGIAPSSGALQLLSTSPHTFGPCSVSYAITLNVFSDNNHDGNWDAPGEPGYNGNVDYSGPLSGSVSTGVGGTTTISNVTTGTEDLELTNIPSTNGTAWDIMPGNPQSASGPPDATVNFALQPLSPTCSSITANPSTIYQGQTSTITANCTSNSGQQIIYQWQMPPGQQGTVANTGTNTTTYAAPGNAQPNGTMVDPTVEVCNPGVNPATESSLCRPYSATVTILPLFTISGNVFSDANKDTIMDSGESNYTGSISVSAGAGSVSYPSVGGFTIANLQAGEYFVTLQKVHGYGFTTSQTLSVKVGPNNGQGPNGSGLTLTRCDPEASSGSCNANGDITSLNFGISNSFSWIQTGSAGGLPPGVGLSGDSSFAEGVTNPIPPAAASCTPYSSLNGPATPGIINSSSVAPSFCSGGDPGCLDQSSSTQWVTGGATYPNPFKPSNIGIIRTSFGYVSSLAQAAGVDLSSSSNDIAQYCSGGIANCALSGSIPHGVYIAKGDLTLVGSGYIFPTGQNFVILVDGNLTIKENVHVPNGSAVLFTSSKNIYIDPTVGESLMTSTISDIDGFYSADKSFVVQRDPSVSCPTPDNRLNISGSIVVNAGLNGGIFQNQRDLCAGDLQCPSFYIGGRPDLIINSPQFIWNTKKVWQELVP